MCAYTKTGMQSLCYSFSCKPRHNLDQESCDVASERKHMFQPKPVKVAMLQGLKWQKTVSPRRFVASQACVIGAKYDAMIVLQLLSYEGLSDVNQSGAVVL